LHRGIPVRGLVHHVAPVAPDGLEVEEDEALLLPRAGEDRVGVALPPDGGRLPGARRLVPRPRGDRADREKRELQPADQAHAFTPVVAPERRAAPTPLSSALRARISPGGGDAR